FKEKLKSTNDETQHDLEQHESVNSPSDDSCPPGLEYLKQTTTCHKLPASPKNTKCTTSFTKYREREYKGTYFMVNVYGPHVPNAKVIVWQKLLTFIHQHQAQIFNSFIESSGLKEMLMGGKYFTWMNKSGTKMSRLDRFLISDEILDENIDLKAIVLDRLWSDHSPIPLHSLKTNYGSIPFKFFQLWFQRKDIDDVVKQAFADCSKNTVELRVPLHAKLKYIKKCLKTWNLVNKQKDISRKQE
nr:RNA-directed DNA polymerase, eukaryota, reverse transcriptase zinc-binding domain protein [Tanacetum cinerariifolium]